MKGNATAEEAAVLESAVLRLERELSALDIEVKQIHSALYIDNTTPVPVPADETPSLVLADRLHAAANRVHHAVEKLDAMYFLLCKQLGSLKFAE